MRIHEVIYFTHELDMLEAHLEEHQHFVDKFFIKESPVLWTGVEKPLIFTEHKSRFERFNVEVMVIPADEFDLSIPRKFPSSEHKKWFDVRRKNRVRSRTYRWEDITRNSDWALSMDCDEIIDSRRAHLFFDIVNSRPELEHVAIRLNQRQFWVNAVGRKLDLYRAFRSDIPHRLQVKGYPRAATPLIGWHFTNCYTPEDIRMKALGITTHYGLNGVDMVPSADEIAQSLKSGKDPFRTRWSQGQLKTTEGNIADTRLDDPDNLSWAPKYMRENPEKFPLRR